MHDVVAHAARRLARGMLVVLACLALLMALAAPAQAEPSDAQIRNKVQGALEIVEDLRELEVVVSNGVVVLTGTTATASSATKAEAIASKVEGVVSVENRLRRTTNVSERIAPAWQRLRQLANEAVAWLPLLGIALLIMLVGWFLARLIGSWNWFFSKLTENRFARDLLRQLVRSAVFLASVILALDILDATALVGAILGTAGVAGLAIGFAFRDLFENYIASILLSVKRPFGPGDHIRIGEDEGKVALLTTRATVLRTLDGNHLRILNADVYKARIVNYSRNALRRFEFTIGVGVNEDLVAARALGRRTMEAMDGVLNDPPPQVVIDDLGDSSVQMLHYGWVNQKEADFQKVRGEAIRQVKQAFETEGFDLPEPIQRLRIERWSPPPKQAAETTTVPRPAEPPQDISPDRHLDDAIAEERAAAGEGDLLQAAGASELSTDV